MSASSVASPTPLTNQRAPAISPSQASACSGVEPEAASHLASHLAGLDSNTLLQGQKAVTIVHNGTPYRLQATKLGKLILTK